MSRKERYKKNRARVFEIYRIKRTRKWNCHHIEHRKDGGGDEKENLFPTPKRLHRLFHKPGTDNQLIHDFCEREYKGDPYERK
jgi:hypothetical protein